MIRQVLEEGRRERLCIRPKLQSTGIWRITMYHGSASLAVVRDITVRVLFNYVAK